MINHETFKKQMEYWVNFSILKSKKHQIAASKNNLFSQVLGLPTVLITTITGTAVLSNSSGESSTTWSMTIGILNIVAGALSAARNYMGFERKHSLHHESYKKYAKFSRKVNGLKITTKKENYRSIISELTIEFNNIADSEPMLPQNLMITMEDIENFKDNDCNNMSAICTIAVDDDDNTQLNDVSRFLSNNIPQNLQQNLLSSDVLQQLNPQAAQQAVQQLAQQATNVVQNITTQESSNE